MKEMYATHMDTGGMTVRGSGGFQVIEENDPFFDPPQVRLCLPSTTVCPQLSALN